MQILNISHLSFWERKTYFEEIDYLVIGAGIVGLSTAIELRNRFPESKIVVFERGFLPTGASSKNAGFTCFGSVTEILDDLENFEEATVWSTVEKRWKGLQNLRNLIGDSNMDFEMNGSWDLILPSDKKNTEEINSRLPYLNKKIEEITGENTVYSEDKDCASKFGFTGVETSYYNRLEGQINTGKMIDYLHKIAVSKNIKCIYGITVEAIQSGLYHVSMQTSVGFMKAKNVAVCTNGFAKQLMPHLNVKPARAQVIVTTPIHDLKIKGTFHYQQGYYYFRNIEGRILLGGGRNLDFEGETTIEMVTTEKIIDSLKELMNQVILPETDYSIEYEWSGIMGIGETKSPIVEKLDERIAVGVRMGGMGVAIGSLIGKELSQLF
jgi:gamma-glutamylputrescine oxidase